jgi:hypothetical protein
MNAKKIGGIFDWQFSGPESIEFRFSSKDAAVSFAVGARLLGYSPTPSSGEQWTLSRLLIIE